MTPWDEGLEIAEFLDEHPECPERHIRGANFTPCPSGGVYFRVRTTCLGRECHVDDSPVLYVDDEMVSYFISAMERMRKIASATVAARKEAKEG